ncbi:FkbM family methyltransferase [Rhodocytophaga aerolata]|uniref:FkbM family methyltransferase n=1 Tax=Rhodocytophaga aerolata TaxID=455078 RepID=A0ABT8R9T7_9BACT|nr:FkbM family methyltransferase [Rhodocytophaga aerolata]MDO1448851.1 FkbM family methyltransferase [Rhodocytophaga aerolata]
MSELLKAIRQNAFINKLVRTGLKKISEVIPILTRLKKRWPVSGIVTLRFEGTSFKAYAACDDHIINNLFYESTYEQRELKIISILSKSCKVILDIGANTGIYSIVASLNNPSLKIFAFEPHPQNYVRLQKNVSLNQPNSVVPVQSAVGNSTGTIDFYIPADDSITDISSVSKEFSESIYRMNFKKIAVDLVTVDEFLELRQEQKVDVIKIDVEGYEYEVILGAYNTIKQQKPIILCEVFSSPCESEESFKINHPNVYMLQCLLIELQYHIYEIDDNSLNYLTSFNFPHKNRNYIFLHNKIVDKKISINKDLYNLVCN